MPISIRSLGASWVASPPRAWYWSGNGSTFQRHGSRRRSTSMRRTRLTKSPILIDRTGSVDSPEPPPGRGMGVSTRNGIT